jgi:xanthosine utilization system XapX-like protein
MPRKGSDLGPAPETMTWRKALPVFIVAGIFDLLRMMCEQLWFFGPAIVAAYCANKVGDSALNVGGVLTKACIAGATLVGAYGLPVIEAMGIVLAIAVGFMGWLVVGLILMTTNRRIFSENAVNIAWFGFSLLISEVPFVGTLPALTGTLAKLYRTQINKEKAALAAYTKQVQEEQVRLRQEQAAELMQARSAQESQMQEAADDAEFEQEQAAADEEESEEIPAEQRLAA